MKEELKPGTLLMRPSIAEIRRSARGCAVLLPFLIAISSHSQIPDPVESSQLKETALADGSALAFAKYLASLQERNPFTESGPICIAIHASIPGLAKQGNLLAIRQTGASELNEYTVTKLDGDSLVKQQIIARYLAAQKQAETIPYSAVAVTPVNYKFHYAGSFAKDKTSVYVFQIAPRKKRYGLIRGEIWIDSATGFAVHQAGRFIKRPSVFIRQLDYTRDVNLLDGVPATRVTHLAIRTVPLGRVELTITERPARADDREPELPKTSHNVRH